MHLTCALSGMDSFVACWQWLESEGLWQHMFQDHIRRQTRPDTVEDIGRDGAEDQWESLVWTSAQPLMLSDGRVASALGLAGSPIYYTTRVGGQVLTQASVFTFEGLL